MKPVTRPKNARLLVTVPADDLEKERRDKRAALSPWWLTTMGSGRKSPTTGHIGVTVVVELDINA